MSQSRFVSFASDERVGIITLERIDALNAISGEMAEEIADNFRVATSRRDLWVVLLCAAGDKAFCVGADLKERASFTLEDFHANRKQMRAMFQAVRDTPQPTIASVFGYALGGGFELALSCDLIVAAEGTVMGLPEARVGLLPAGGGTQLLPRAIGGARAKELIFTGRRFDAAEGERVGMVTKVVPRGELPNASIDLARAICRSSPVAVAEAKAAVDAALGTELERGIEIENGAWARVVASADRSEGIRAFNEKRDARWRNT